MGWAVAVWVSLSIAMYGLLGVVWGVLWLEHGPGGAAWGLFAGACLGTALGVIVAAGAGFLLWRDIRDDRRLSEHIVALRAIVIGVYGLPLGALWWRTGGGGGLFVVAIFVIPILVPAFIGWRLTPRIVQTYAAGLRR